MVRCTEDRRLGPVIGEDSECGRFDFTVAFEEAVFAIAPCVVALLIVPLRLKVLWGRERMVRWPTAERLKMVLYHLLGASQLGVLGLQARPDFIRTNLTIPSGVLALIATIGLAALSTLDGQRTLAPSATIQTFLLFTSLFDIARARTLWLVDENDSLTKGAFFTTIVVKAALLVLESQQKMKHAKGSGAEGVSKEKASGVFSRSFLLWLNPLILLGNQKSLVVEDMYEVDQALRGRTVDEEISAAWDIVPDQSEENALFFATMRAFLGPYLLTLLPSLALTFFSLLQPLLIERVIKFVQDPETPVSHGHALIGGYVVIYLGIVVCTAWNGNIQARYLARTRGGLVALIYRGMLGVRAESKAGSQAMQMMGAEVERILMMQIFIINIIPAVVQIVFGVAVLSTQLGILCLVPVGITLVFGLGSLPVAKMVAPRQRQWMLAIQKRVGVTSDIFSVIKGVKMTGLTAKVQDQLQGLRDFELDESKRFRRVQIAHVLLGQFSTLITPALTFAAFAGFQSLRGGQTLDVSTAFTTMSLLNLLINPVSSIIMIPPTFTSALQCFARIQEFLNEEKREDFRNFKLHSSDAHLAIQISQASFGWDEKKPPVLNDISLDILRGSLSIIVGPVASGKSTLLKSLAGETRRLKGRVVCFSPRLAYCDQEPWILNQTIRENILGGEEFEEGLYDRAIKSCQLEEDLGALPEGDRTVVGSGGASLSGGQKHRIALARAAYSRRDMIILDDSLKGLDADTGKACFDALLSPGGLMRMDEQTIILATHNAQWLPYADQIIALGEDGSISEMGTYQDLTTNSGYISALKKQGALTNETSGTSTPNGAKPSSHKQSNPATKTTKDPSLRTTSGKLLDSPKERKQKIDRGGRGAFRHYIRSLGKASFPTFVLLVLLQAGCRTMQRLWLKFWVSANERDPNADTTWWISLYVMWGFLTAFSLVVEAWFLLVVVIPHSAKVLHLGVLKAALAAPLSFFVKTDVGDIVNRFSQDMRLIDLPLPISFMLFSDNGALCLAELAMTCLASRYLALAIPPLFVVLYSVQRRYLATSRQVRILETETKAPLFSHFISTAAGLVTVRAYNLQGRVRAQNLSLIDTAQRPFYMFTCMQHWLSVVISGVLAGFAILLVSLAVRLRETIDPGLLGVALVSVSSFGQVLGWWLKHWANLEESLGAVERVRRFQNDTPKERDGVVDSGAPWPHLGAISLRGVHASFGEHEVLKDINLSIEPGQKVAICGRTGSGKSTLLSLLLRLHDPSKGTILIDGVDVSSVKLDALRTSVAALPQDALFLPGTIRDNIDPFRGASDDEIWIALGKTGLKDLVGEKGGLDVDLNTDWLSAGQKQLFCMARAMLRRGRVLLLDEATSSLDHRTEEIVQNLIETVFKGWTTIVIAHRLKTVVNFDKVVVLQDGRVVEFESPRKLLEKEGGVFSGMWKAQES